MDSFQIDSLISFFDELGWIGNLITIITPAITCGVFFRGYVRHSIGKEKLEKLIPHDFEHKWNPIKAKAWAKIAIVDDQPNDFPVSELRGDGFQIQVHKSATLATTAQLSLYAIVFLDMKGIVKDDPENGGLKLIAELIKKNPKQKICAVSSKKFDATATEFFRQADDIKTKPLTAHECRDVINNFLTDLYPASALITLAKEVISGFTRKSRIAIVSEFSKFIRNETEEKHLVKKLQKLGLTAAQYEQILNLAKAIIHEVD